MLKQIFSPIEEHLQATQEILTKTCRIKAGSLDFLAYREFPPNELAIRPALVILSAGMFGPVTRRAIHLAAMFQFVYIASSLHKDISEDTVFAANSKHSNSSRQFLILTGDYFYSKSFVILCEAGLLKYLRTLSELIGELNELSIRKLKNPGDLQVLEDYVKKDTASLYAWSCKLGAEISGAGEQEVENLYRYGFHLGMAAGLRKEEIYPEKVAACFQKAKEQLEALPAGTARDSLGKLADYLHSTG